MKVLICQCQGVQFEVSMKVLICQCQGVQFEVSMKVLICQCQGVQFKVSMKVLVTERVQKVMYDRGKDFYEKDGLDNDEFNT